MSMDNERSWSYSEEGGKSWCYKYQNNNPNIKVVLINKQELAQEVLDYIQDFFTWK